VKEHGAEKAAEIMRSAGAGLLFEDLHLRKASGRTKSERSRKLLIWRNGRPASRRGQAWGASTQVSPHIRGQLGMDHAREVDRGAVHRPRR
jgi:hypothetical protein